MDAKPRKALVVGGVIGLALMAAVVWGFQQPGGILGMILLVAIMFGIPLVLLGYGLVVAIRRLVRSGGAGSPPS